MNDSLQSAAVVRAVELAYFSGSDAAWREGIFEQLLDIFPGSSTAGFYEYALTDLKEGCALKLTSPLHTVGQDHHGMDGLLAMETAPPTIVEMLFHRTSANTASAETGLGAAMVETPQWQGMWKPNIKDSLGFTVCDLRGRGMLFFTGLTKVTLMSPRQRALASKVAIHLGAGHRLRTASKQSSLDDAEAIFTPNGKMLHAREAAKNKRELIDDGRRRRDEARKTKHDAEKALEIWKGLVAGRWSLVDHFDTDGKRFLLAMKNTPKIDRREDLTPRERRVAALVSHGHRDKEIAYMLGLTMPSVLASLHRARTKLKVKTRAELATVWRSS